MLAGNDDIAEPVSAIPYFGFIDSRKYTLDPMDPVHSCTRSLDYKTAWWSFVATADGTLEVAAQGRRYDIFGNSGIVLTVYDTDRTAGNELSCSVYPRNTSTWTSTTVQLHVTKGNVYQIEISATGDSANDGGQTFLSVVMK